MLTAKKLNFPEKLKTASGKYRVNMLSNDFFFSKRDWYLCFVFKFVLAGVQLKRKQFVLMLVFRRAVIKWLLKYFVFGNNFKLSA